MSFFQPRDQIEYTAVDKREYGFVTRIGGDGTVFCRFWRPFEDGGECVLRTIANSEGCDAFDLKKCDCGAEDEVRIICAAMGWC